MDEPTLSGPFVSPAIYRRLELVAQGIGDVMLIDETTMTCGRHARLPVC